MVRCPACNSSAVRKREMIVKAGSYTRVGGSAGLSGKSSTRVYVSRGKSDWVEELKPMSYFWPCLMALFLWGSYSDPEQSFFIGSWLAVAVNILWFMIVRSDHKDFREEWACSRCGEVWNPSEPKQISAEECNSTDF